MTSCMKLQENLHGIKAIKKQVKKKEVVKRMTEIETIFGKPNLFQKEKEILK